MKCLNQQCNAEDIKTEDNFCYKCGNLTAKGFSFIRNKENVEKIMQGDAVKQSTRMSLLISVSALGIIIFTIMVIIIGGDIFRTGYFIKRKVDSLIYGYNTAIIKTDNIYKKEKIDSIEDAKEIIIKDFDFQNWKCSYSLETFKLEIDLEKKYDITSVSLCDVAYSEAEKIVDVVDKMYSLFPMIKGALTNISITNAKTKEEYIAYFQPMFQFVNPDENTEKYNKVNKTQILLNSYYLLNKNIMNQSLESIVGENWYVKDATWESTIAHEMGHYITFKTFLKQKGLDNIILVTKDNEKNLNELLEEYDSRYFSKLIVELALSNYNNTNGTNLDLYSYALSISNYAGVKDKDGNLLYDETIAEAMHDYYLHGQNCSKSSFEILEVIREKLQVINE